MNFTEYNGNSTQIYELCENYVSSWMINIIVVSVPLPVVMLCRFIYARHSPALISDANNNKLFHKLVGLAMIIFSLQLILMWPVQYEMNNKRYKSTLKWRICTKTLSQDKFDHIEFSIKPKLTICTIVILYAIGIYSMYKSIKGQTKKNKIPRVRRNIMDADLTFKIFLINSVNVFIDQIVNIPLEVFRRKLGDDAIFKIWWIWHFVMFCQCYLLGPALIIIDASRNFPEFQGLEAKSYPGQQGPRSQRISPYRQNFSSPTVKNIPASKVCVSFVGQTEGASKYEYKVNKLVAKDRVDHIEFRPPRERTLNRMTSIEIVTISERY